MCGISGTIGLADRGVIEAMTEAIAHRGPDDGGIFVDTAGGVALGHRRLSIIDLSSAGHQPMGYWNDRYWTVFNGEIYNFMEIRSELEQRGHMFRSTSDTEVLLAAYAEWGAACLERLRGMFAFAVYDRASEENGGERVFLARDRFGIKPLYYARGNNVFLFASEIKALSASGLISNQVDYQSVWDYLSLGSIPQPRTILSDVKALLPGHAMTINSCGEIKEFSYWDIVDRASGSFARVAKMDKIEATKELRRLLEEATRLHMIADVPIGAFLSGGIDSTAVLGLMSQYVSRPIRTYSIGFESSHARLNEFKWAKLAAERLKSDHTEVIVTGGEIAGQCDNMVRAIDQPSLDGTNTYLVSKAARIGVTVALSGIGGDELFAGYPHFQRFVRAAHWDKAGLFPVKRLKKSLLRALPGRWLPDKHFLMLNPLSRLSTLRCLADEEEKQLITAK
jgi:asparagine synthase (glutamine-hydrolysing)